MSQWQPRVFRPDHIRCVRLYWQGYNAGEIANFTGLTQQHVTLILNTDEAKAMLAQLKSHTINSIDEVQDEAQLAAPLCMREKVRLALESSDERVRNVACSDILAIAGHSPVKRVVLDRQPADATQVEGLDENAIRNDILKDLFTDGPQKPPEGTLLN